MKLSKRVLSSVTYVTGTADPLRYCECNSTTANIAVDIEKRTIDRATELYLIQIKYFKNLLNIRCKGLGDDINEEIYIREFLELMSV